MERMLNRFPNTYDFSTGFNPGVRFYFKYDDIINHADYTNDGHHPAKIKNALSLADYLHCCIIPKAYKAVFKDLIPGNLADSVFYVENDCKDIWEWSDKVYCIAREYRRKK